MLRSFHTDTGGPTGEADSRGSGDPLNGPASWRLLGRTAVGGLVLLLLLSSTHSGLAQTTGGDYSEALRERLGVNPLKRQPLVTLYRMDLAGNFDGVLDPNEIPVGAEEYVAGIVRHVKFDASRPVKLTKLATQWHLNPPPRPPLRSFVIKPAEPTEDTHARENSAAKSGSPQDYGASLLSLYDKDGSGLLEKGEWSRIGEGWDGADQNGDGKLSADELAQRLAAVAANAVPEQDEPTPSLAESSSHDGSNTPPPAYVDRSGKPDNHVGRNLPRWFLDRDADGDGQVKMCEYASQWTPQLVNRFAQYDLNGDGIITPSECRKASAAITNDVDDVLQPPARPGD